MGFIVTIEGRRDRHLTYDLLYIAPLPPRYSGQTMSSVNLAKRLQAAGISLQVSDTALRNPVGIQYKFARALRLLRSLLHCATCTAPRVYISVNANRGMWVTITQVALARLRGRKVFLHHHTNGHLTKRERVARILFQRAGPNAVNIVICETMAEQMRTYYPETATNDIICVSNIGVVADLDTILDTKPLGKPPFVLGHLSNLTIEKGCLRAIDTFLLARKAGLARELVLAGPIHDSDLRKKVETQVSESCGAIRYLGPVHGTKKTEFFDSIDVFLFPTLYRNETQGIVNLEALSTGRPVVAYSLCCIIEDLADPSCCLVPPEAEFAPFAINFLAQIHSNPASYHTMARQRFEVLVATNKAQHAALRNLLKL